MQQSTLQHLGPHHTARHTPPAHEKAAYGAWMPPVADLKGKKQKQPSSCPDGWLTAALVVQLELTHRQEKYARRAVGIARFVYNRMVANDQAGRDAGLWLTPHELEKGIQLRQTDQPITGLHDPGQQICRPGRLPQLPQRPLKVAEQTTQIPQTHFPQEKTHRHRLVPGGLGCELHQIRRTPPHTAALPGQRQIDPRTAGGDPIRGHHSKAQRALVRQHRLLETAHAIPLPRNSIGRRS